MKPIKPALGSNELGDFTSRSVAKAKEMGPVELNLLIAKLARRAALCDRGVTSGGFGGMPKKTLGRHEGGAKAYRDAIELVMQAQRDISRSAKAREQQVN